MYMYINRYIDIYLYIYSDIDIEMKKIQVCTHMQRSRCIEAAGEKCSGGTRWS